MAAFAILPRILVDPGSLKLRRTEKSFHIDSPMDRRRRNNNPGLEIADLSGLLAKQVEMKQKEKEELIKYGSADEFYDMNEEIGKGAYGIVKKCVDKATGQTYAAKVVTTSNSNLRKETMREIEVMRKLGSHKKLVGLIDAYHTPFEIVMILEFIPGGELFERIIEEDYLMEEDAIYYVHQVLLALDYMHGNNIVHLDLKPENIMCESINSNQIKLVDFGLARELKKDEEVKSSFGTPDFVAPEVIRMKPVSTASDMWSLGVVTYVLLSGLMPFSGDNDHDTLVKVAKAEWDFDDECFDEVSEDAKDFIEGLLVKDPTERFTIAECLTLPWLKAKHQMGKIDTKKHKSFFAKRRWKKSINAMVALRRMSLSPVSRARRGSMDTALLQKKADEKSERKGSFPSNLAKAVQQKNMTGPTKPGKLSVDSKENSIEEKEEPELLGTVGLKKPRSHSMHEESSARSNRFAQQGDCRPSIDIVVNNVETSSTDAPGNDEQPVSQAEYSASNGDDFTSENHEDKVFSKENNTTVTIQGGANTPNNTDNHAEGGIVHEKAEINNNEAKENVDRTRVLLPAKYVTVNTEKCKKSEVKPAMKSQTTEENDLSIAHTISAHIESELRERSSSFTAVPSIIINETRTYQNSIVSVKISQSTSEPRIAKSTVYTKQTTNHNAHVCSQSTADQTSASITSYTMRKVDRKGQTITVRLDELSSLELPASRETCTHVRRASTGSEAIEFVKSIQNKLS
ncbi:calcium-dependent protein kinase 21 isoform X2 [Nematostella vectensis]|uniref:calcium-dependent protein kinase 21 isoform X2 n=1 Tax=Nematostella vectensis TaxID=45351 RepID=UPI0020770A3B|nr:calcium-dependent protein kinase 21 isoform X2 [Nematostella vectensis]